MSFERLNALADSVGCLPDAHHERDVGTVDIGIEKASAMAEFCERDGEIDGDRTFTYTAFAGTHGDDVLNAGNRQLRLLAARLWTHNLKLAPDWLVLSNRNRQIRGGHILGKRRQRS